MIADRQGKLELARVFMHDTMGNADFGTRIHIGVESDLPRVPPAVLLLRLAHVFPLACVGQAFKLFCEALEGGDYRAVEPIAECYFEGFGVEKDYRKAVQQCACICALAL